MDVEFLTPAPFPLNNHIMASHIGIICVLFVGVSAVQSAPDDVQERVFPAIDIPGPATLVGGLFTKTDFGILDFPFLSFTEGPLCSVSLIGRNQAVGSSFCIDNHLYDTEKYNNFLGIFAFLSLFIKRKVLIMYGLDDVTRKSVRNAYDNHNSTSMEITRNDVVFPKNYNFLNIYNVCRNDIALVNLPKPIKHGTPMAVAANNVNGLTTTLGPLTNLYIAGYGSKSCRADAVQRRRANARVVPCPASYGNVSACGNQFCVNITDGNYTNVYESIGDMGGPVMQCTNAVDMSTCTLIGSLSFQNKLTPIGEGCTKGGTPQLATLLPFYMNDFMTDFSTGANNDVTFRPLVTH